MSMLKSLHSSQKPIYPGLPLDLYFSVHCTPLIAHSILPFYDIFTTTNLLPVSISDLIQLTEMQEQSTGCEGGELLFEPGPIQTAKHLPLPAIRHSLKVAQQDTEISEKCDRLESFRIEILLLRKQSLHTRDNDH